jgi:hypothetical protein
VTKQFEIWLGRRVVSTRRAPSAREAAIDYVRALGCPPSQLTYLAFDAVSWHGAVYRARPVAEETATPGAL